MQGVMAQTGVGRGDVVAGLTSNRIEAWCAGVAAQALGAITTPLHPLGSLQDHMNQIEDTEASFLLIDVDRYRDRAECAIQSGNDTYNNLDRWTPAAAFARIDHGGKLDIQAASRGRLRPCVYGELAR